MSERLKALHEQRDAALSAYNTFIDPLIESGDALTEEQETRRGELRSAIETVDARIDEVEAEETRASTLAEKRAGFQAANTATVEVTNEPTTYGPDSPNSYFADLARSYSPAWHGHFDAVARLQRASHEAAVEMATGKSEKRRKIESLLREEHRGNEGAAERIIRETRELGRSAPSREVRSGMDTTSGSGGSFATPMYFVSEYAPFRQPGRPFIDQCNKQELPDYGMTVYLPHVTGGAGVAAQASQNTGVQETDPTAGYLSANLTTEAGEVTISQQLLDRSGPNFKFDVMVFDQLNRAYAPVVDTFALTTALAGAGAITYTSTSFALNVANGVGGFTSKVGGAKSAIRKASGTVLPSTHLFLAEDRWEYIEAWGDGQGRPVVVPGYGGPFNALAAGANDGDAGVVEGFTGYKLAGLPVFTDLSIPAPGTGNDQAIVANLDEVYIYEGSPVTRVLPQTLGSQLSVILQMYSYIAGIVRYPLAVQAISGTGMAAIAF